MTTPTSYAADRYNREHSLYSIATVPYTKKEITLPCVSVGYLIGIAKVILKGKPVCIDHVIANNLVDEDLLTMSASGRVLDELLADSIYYNNAY